VPLALLLLLVLELSGANALLLHALFIALATGRALHAWGVSHEPENFTFRVSGMLLTFSVLIFAALTLAWHTLV
jgi:uncharacterized membrane protein YecN with MAPEG domain